RLFTTLGQEGPVADRLEDVAQRFALHGIVIGDKNRVVAIQGHDDRSRSKPGDGMGASLARVPCNHRAKPAGAQPLLPSLSYNIQSNRNLGFFDNPGIAPAVADISATPRVRMAVSG